jgi:CBS domain-containing protein
VKKSALLEDVVRQLVEHKVHRLFVVDENHAPIGVISLREILLELINIDPIVQPITPTTTQPQQTNAPTTS